MNEPIKPWRGLIREREIFELDHVFCCGGHGASVCWCRPIVKRYGLLYFVQHREDRVGAVPQTPEPQQ